MYSQLLCSTHPHMESVRLSSLSGGSSNDSLVDRSYTLLQSYLTAPAQCCYAKQPDSRLVSLQLHLWTFALHTGVQPPDNITCFTYSEVRCRPSVSEFMLPDCQLHCGAFAVLELSVISHSAADSSKHNAAIKCCALLCKTTAIAC